MQHKLTQSLTQDELNQLNKFLSSTLKDAEPMSLTEAHGFLTAILSAPNLIMPSKWQPVLFGGYPEFESKEQAVTIVGLINRLYNEINRELSSNNNIFSILLFENGNEVPVNQASLDLAKEWCRGYLEGAELDELWSEDEKENDLLLPFEIVARQAIFISNIGKGVNSKDSDPMEGELEHRKKTWALLPNYIKEVHGYWLNYRSRPHYNNERYDNNHPIRTSKTGRNDLCPCGSGKKYKKCCITTNPSIH
jgi:uncharacterized protein